VYWRRDEEVVPKYDWRLQGRLLYRSREGMCMVEVVEV
jgi:hypothetical protein